MARRWRILKKLTCDIDLAIAQRLLVKYGVFPGDYLRRSPGERAVVCAMLLDYDRRREEGE